MDGQSRAEVLTTREVAERLAVDPTTVTRWAREGIVPAVKIGRTLRFRRVDIERLLTPKAAS